MEVYAIIQKVIIGDEAEMRSCILGMFVVKSPMKNIILFAFCNVKFESILMYLFYDNAKLAMLLQNIVHPVLPDLTHTKPALQRRKVCIQ